MNSVSARKLAHAFEPKLNPAKEQMHRDPQSSPGSHEVYVGSC